MNLIIPKATAPKNSNNNNNDKKTTVVKPCLGFPGPLQSYLLMHNFVLTY